MAKSVFYSFHYTRDVGRVQLVQKIGALEGQPLLNSQDWESKKQQGTAAIQQWIDDQMKHKSAVIVLIGRETASREWVKYEIARAWSLKRPLLGINIHGISSFGSADSKGSNPFDKVPGASGVPVFDPTVRNAVGTIDTKATYANLERNLPTWAAKGVTRW